MVCVYEGTMYVSLSYSEREVHMLRKSLNQQTTKSTWALPASIVSFSVVSSWSGMSQ